MRTAYKLNSILVSCWLLAATLAAPITTLGEVDFPSDVRALLQRYCYSCHGTERQRGEINLAIYANKEEIQRDRKTWQRVQDMVFRHKMPPQEEPQPSQNERDTLVAWIGEQLASVDCSGPQDPGRVTLRRLNRTEYANTIRDLLGVSFDTEQLPADDVGHGFDNIGDVLSLSPALLEKYATTGAQIADQVVREGADADDDAGREARLFTCTPGEDGWEPCAQRILQRLTRRAYRRPPHDDEIRRLLEIVRGAKEGGATFERSIGVALEAVLLSPNFLFHVVSSGPSERSGEIHSLNDHELADRLSYFIWRSLPDDELFSLAERGKLRHEDVLAQQVHRLLEDPKSQALATSFAAQWLQLDKLESSTPDPARFPGFTGDLRQSMRRETELYFEHVLREDRSILALLDSDFTFLDERLARHYALAEVEGTSFRRVELPGGRRGGVITQASILTLTSNPTRTSPVNRGKWILEQVLGTPPPPPPADVEELPEDEEALAASSLRQRLEVHRADPGCASCHDRMDPLGFALENFDAVGAWRERDGVFLVDASGTLPDGSTFEGPAELKRILVERREDFVRCFTEKMLTYALGRGVEYYDYCTVEGIAAAVADDGYRLSRLVLEIVKSVPFRMRRSLELETGD